jgi:hypothetical protein
LAWWTDYLVPVLEKFVRTYEGERDQNFWNCCYKIHSGGEGYERFTAVNGWVNNFFPYSENYR